MQVVTERLAWKSRWQIEKYRSGEDVPYEVVKFDGNLALNEGINELLLLLIGGGGTAYNNANTYIGVGDSESIAAAAQVGLQAVTNKIWAAMEATYPTDPPVNQQVVFKASFAAGVGTFAWKEFTVVNDTDDDGKNLCRKVSDQGTKAAGDTWVVTYTIGFD